MTHEIRVDYRSRGVCIVPAIEESPRVYRASDPRDILATVTLDGADVSEWCTEACPGEDWVEMVVLDESGHVLTDRGSIATTRCYGVVTVELDE